MLPAVYCSGAVHGFASGHAPAMPILPSVLNARLDLFPHVGVLREHLALQQDV
jgi:hypothetical protein